MESLFIGRQIIETDVVDSTNNFTANLLNATNVPEGTVIMAREQTAGRGQRGSTWISEKGKNLTVSVVLYPKFIAVKDQFFISIITALGICEALSSELQNITIKWPNDIYAGKKKVAGILIENSIDGNFLRSSIVGIGVNINQLQFPDDVNATSVCAETGIMQDLPYWLKKICAQIEAAYLALRSGKQESLKARYLENLLYYREKRTFIVNGTEIRGMITGINEDGKLLLEEEDAITRIYDLKEIKFLI